MVLNDENTPRNLYRVARVWGRETIFISLSKLTSVVNYKLPIFHVETVNCYILTAAKWNDTIFAVHKTKFEHCNSRSGTIHENIP
jgi:hypothetical protein